MLKEIFHHQRSITDQVDFTLNFFRNLRHYLIKIAQAWNLAQGKTIESQMTNWDKKLYSVATQISILICFFCRNVRNKQKTNRKNILTAGKQYFIKRLLEILTNSMRNTSEGILKMYFLTDVFIQFLKISETLFWDTS